jgi:1,2-diacylglycerol 3-alpha-glucosyltransferase
MIATETYTPLVNGPSVFTERLATGLAHRGHDVVVAAPSPNRHRFVEEPSRGLTIYRVRSIPTPYPQQRCALLTRGDADGLLTDFHPDLVHIQNHFVLGRALARAARRRQIPAVGTNHFMPANMLPHAPGVLLRLAPLRRGLSAALWRQFVSVYRVLDAVTVPSQAAAALARAQGLRGPIHVISNGVDVMRFHPARDHFDGGGRAARIVYVGRLDPDKEVEVLIRAMPHVVRRRRVEVVLAGRGTDERPLRRLATRLGVSECVQFPGFVGDAQLPGLLRTAMLFVMPSPNELQSIATLEAMASGLPVVAADAVALPELIDDGRNGFLFPPGEARALADRVERVLADPSRAAGMGQASRMIAEGHSLERTLGAFEALYGRLVKRSLAA